MMTGPAPIRGTIARKVDTLNYVVTSTRLVPIMV